MTIMQRITFDFVIPAGMFVRRNSKGELLCSRNAHDVYWICESCGPVEPIACSNGFMRRQCTCERLAREKVISTQKQAISNRCYSWLGQEYILTDLEHTSFENFYPQHQTKNVKEYHGHLAMVRSYADRLVQGEQVENLMMVGSVGTGKTHLATAICNHLRAHHVSCLFCAVPDLFNELYSSTLPEQNQLLLQAGSTSLLVLDDLDKLHVRKDTNGAFQKETLYSIINRRYVKRLPTIITTNEQSDFSRWFDDATVSRLFERLTPLRMSGMDYRSRGRQS